jgi:pantoate--beta-alanine ligase
MYPADPEVRLIAGSLGKHLCGPSRPGHFDGVVTVVAKLFNIVEPDIALFGRKDFQQAQIVKQMASQLNFPTEVVIAPTVRDVDSVALSSRNAYLSEADREVARRIPLALDAAHKSFLAGKTCVDDLVAEVRNTFSEHEGATLDYVEIIDPSSLAPIRIASSDSIVGLAARIGGTRLIDNIVVGDGVGGDDFVHG